ncbi:MAG: hypothetical protein JO085_04205 [Acidimicrobiia bacterium]|nr:hypothetical protein [Acidimicrobiia bacterium]
MSRIVRTAAVLAVVTMFVGFAGACSSGGGGAAPSTSVSSPPATAGTVPPVVTAPTPTVGPSGGHVPPGTPVEARFNPDNRIVAAVIAGAQAAGLGAVVATRYSPDCSPVPDTVIVCRNASYTGGQTSTATWSNACVVELDPALGSGPRSDAVTVALRRCVA